MSSSTATSSSSSNAAAASTTSRTGIHFQRNVGAFADAKELEYLSALLQTCEHPRDNGLVGSVDVQRLLTSRYGIKISRRQARELVNGLAGTTRAELMLQEVIARQGMERVAAKKKKKRGGRNRKRHESSDNSSSHSNQQQPFESSILNGASSRLSEKGSASLHVVSAAAQDEVEAWDGHFTASSASRNADETHQTTVGGSSKSAKVVDPMIHLSDDDVPEAYFDIVQLFAVLLIPTLAQFARNYQQKKQQQSAEESVLAAVDPRDEVPSSLLSSGLRMMLKDVGSMQDQPRDQNGLDGNEWPPILTIDLVEGILIEVGELELSQDVTLLQSMVQAATTDSGRFDEEALLQALTSDIQEWQVGHEHRLTTLFYDVFEQEDYIPNTYGDAQGSKGIDGLNVAKVIDDNPQKTKSRLANTQGEAFDEEQQKISSDAVESIPLSHDSDAANTFKASSESDKNIPMVDHTGIDYVVDAHSSIHMVIMIWVFYILMTLSYIALARTLVAVPCEKYGSADVDSFGCIFAKVLWQWFAFAVCATLFGLVIMGPLSLGNAARGRKPGRLVVIVLLTVVYLVVPPLVVTRFKQGRTTPYNAAEELVDVAFWQHLQRTTFVAGAILVVGFCFQFCMSLIQCPDDAPLFLRTLTSTSNTIGEFRLKQAASRKLNRTLQNAMFLHASESKFNIRISMSTAQLSVRQASLDKTMLNFVLRGCGDEPAGGFLWTAKKIYSRQLFDTEGLWIPTRILVFQTAQVVLGILLGFGSFTFTERLAQYCEDKRIELAPETPDWVMQLIPTRQNIETAFYPADFVVIVVIVLLVALYIPSACSTIMKFRTGQLASLGSPYFRLYRTAIDTTHMNTGNAIYGLVGAAILFWALVALFIFLFIWEFSQTFMLRVLGWGLGLTITILFKTLLTKTCRRSFRGFYRTHPRSYNIGTLALECWFIGLGASVLIGRITQFLLAAVFWVGRIDVPYLSPNVHVGGYAFDAVPIHFVKELLVHEAHRHPYIERITQMCLMRIKSKSFVNPAGAAWRQVFVQAFMPWLKKHRVLQEARIYAALQALDYRKEELEEGSKTVAARLIDDVRDDTRGVVFGVQNTGEQLVTGTTAIVRGAAHEGAGAVTSAAQGVATATGAVIGGVTSAALSLGPTKSSGSNSSKGVNMQRQAQEAETFSQSQAGQIDGRMCTQGDELATIQERQRSSAGRKPNESDCIIS
ncbi:hypothetical protein MPSEU_000580800 [Mayamaea pseudoterrestris]|nr:hypothetical protein MPSEU_000580800 [Mayamaea pseudoterrestris]